MILSFLSRYAKSRGAGTAPVKTQAIASAADAAIMILWIDDEIAFSKAREACMPPGGPGM